MGFYVPKHWPRTPDCEVRRKEVPMDPEWEYQIKNVKRLKRLV